MATGTPGWQNIDAWRNSNLSPLSSALPEQWGKNVVGEYLSAGYSPAAARQAAVRAKNLGTYDRYAPMDEYIQALMRYERSLKNQRDKIGSTSGSGTISDFVNIFGTVGGGSI